MSDVHVEKGIQGSYVNEIFTSLPVDFYFCGEVTWLAEACGLPLCSAARPRVKWKKFRIF